jgi:hypothetical protein
LCGNRVGIGKKSQIQHRRFIKDEQVSSAVGAMSVSDITRYFGPVRLGGAALENVEMHRALSVMTASRPQSNGSSANKESRSPSHCTRQFGLRLAHLPQSRASICVPEHQQGWHVQSKEVVGPRSLSC